MLWGRDNAILGYEWFSEVLEDNEGDENSNQSEEILQEINRIVWRLNIR